MNEYSMDKINDAVAHYLIKDKSVQAKKMIKKKSEIIVDCLTEESASKAYNVLKKKLDESCDVLKEKIENPKVKLIGINNFETLDNKKMEQDIKERNFSKFSKKCTVLHLYDNSKTHLQSVILEISAELYQHVREKKIEFLQVIKTVKCMTIVMLNHVLNVEDIGTMVLSARIITHA